jgi:hypothetical protein
MCNKTKGSVIYTTSYAVYYKINPTFRVDKKLTKKDLVHGNTHQLVTIVDPKKFKWQPHEDLDTIYMNFQGDFISKENLAAQDNASARAGKRIHTSMSVGDAIINLKTQKAYQCADAGWEEMPAYRKGKKKK